MVVELSMQYCRKSFWDSFEANKTFPRCIITEFECKVDVQNHEFGWVRFEILLDIHVCMFRDEMNERYMCMCRDVEINWRYMCMCVEMLR